MPDPTKARDGRAMSAGDSTSAMNATLSMRQNHSTLSIESIFRSSLPSSKCLARPRWKTDTESAHDLNFLHFFGHYSRSMSQRTKDHTGYS